MTVRAVCPWPGCGRSLALNSGNLVWRHDPPDRDPSSPVLTSCPGSWKPALLEDLAGPVEVLLLFDMEQT